MAASVRCKGSKIFSGTSTTISASDFSDLSAVQTNPQDGDFLVFFYQGYDADTSLTSVPAGATVRVPARNASSQFGAIITVPVSGGASSWAFTQSVSDQITLLAACVTGHDAASPIDGTTPALSTNTSGASHTAPQVTGLSGSDSLWLLWACSFPSSGGGSYSWAAGPTEIIDTLSVGWDFATLAYKQLASSANTGTVVATSSKNNPWYAGSIAIKSASGGATHNADGTLAATGTRTASASSDKPVTATRTGTGTLTASTASDKPVTATRTGTGTLTATAASDKPVTTALAGTGTLTASATVVPAALNASGTLAGTGTLTATATSDKPVTATLAGTGTLTAAGTSTKPVTATLAGTGTLSATATVVTAGLDATAALTGTGTLTATATVTKPVTATLAGTGTLSASATVVGLVTHSASGTLAGTASATASMTVVKPLTASLVAAASATATAALQLLTSPGEMYPRTAPGATMRPRPLPTPTMKGG